MKSASYTTLMTYFCNAVIKQRLVIYILRNFKLNLNQGNWCPLWMCSFIALFLTNILDCILSRHSFRGILHGCQLSKFVQYNWFMAHINSCLKEPFFQSQTLFNTVTVKAIFIMNFCFYSCKVHCFIKTNQSKTTQ